MGFSFLFNSINVINHELVDLKSSHYYEGYKHICSMIFIGYFPVNPWPSTVIAYNPYSGLQMGLVPVLSNNPTPTWVFSHHQNQLNDEQPTIPPIQEPSLDNQQVPQLPEHTMPVGTSHFIEPRKKRQRSNRNFLSNAGNQTLTFAYMRSRCYQILHRAFPDLSEK